MSGYSAAVIDPALQDLPAPRTAGMKRKARSTVAPVHPVHATTQASTRVTRRQAAVAADTPAAPDPAPSALTLAHHVDEPSRGEEENLMRYEWARETTVSLPTRLLHHRKHCLAVSSGSVFYLRTPIGLVFSSTLQTIIADADP